jgi:hypothetical protein
VSAVHADGIGAPFSGPPGGAAETKVVFAGRTAQEWRQVILSKPMWMFTHYRDPEEKGANGGITFSIPRRFALEKNPKAVPLLIQLLQDPSPPVRAYAADWLANHGKKAAIAIPHLRALANDNEIAGFGLPVKDVARSAISHILQAKDD